MIRPASVSITLACALLAAAALGSCATHGGKTTTRKQIDRGAKLFATACAGCHGTDARGHGPVAPLLGAPVADLTHFAARRPGAFPEDELYQIIDGQADLSAHGPRHMPVWGYEFFGESPDDEAAHREATRKIEDLIAFLRSVQRTE